MTKYYKARKIFHQGKLREGYVLAVEQDKTKEIIPAAQCGQDIHIKEVDGILTPGFVEVQANGGGGVLFNDDFSEKGIKTILAAHRQYGTVAMLPTFITDKAENLHRAVASVAEQVAAGLPGLMGGHFEGPFLSPEKKGTHRPDFLRVPDEHDYRCFEEHAAYLQHSIVSLAPERVPAGTVRRFVEMGLHVNMAHSMATHEDLVSAVGEGLKGITHLYNAMRPLSGRDPGPIGSAVSLGLYAGIIADAVHSHPFSLETAYRLLGPDHLMLVTDSMHTIGTDIKEFDLTGQKVFVQEDRLVNEFGSLAGAHVTLLRCLQNAVRYMNASVENALRMSVSTPAHYVGRADLDSITDRRVDDIICLDEQLQLVNWQ